MEWGWCEEQIPPFPLLATGDFILPGTKECMVLRTVPLKNLMDALYFLLFNSLSSCVCSHAASYKVWGFYYASTWIKFFLFDFIVAFYICICFSKALATSIFSALWRALSTTELDSLSLGKEEKSLEGTSLDLCLIKKWFTICIKVVPWKMAVLFFLPIA